MRQPGTQRFPSFPVFPGAAFLLLLTLIGPAAARAAPARAPALARLTVEPPAATLVGPRARQVFIVTATYADGREQDVTGQASFTSLDPGRARVGGRGVVFPAGDGETTLKATALGKSATARLTIRGARASSPVSFLNEVLPALTRAGCNQGACHGAQHGKGGFRLSLLGYDPDLDYRTLVKENEARRVVLPDPPQSLLLRKPTMAVPHAGGLRFKPGSYEYEILAAWLRDGAPGPNPKDPSVTTLAVLPAARVMAPGGQQRLVVRASYSDGSTADVTHTARLNSLNDGIAVLLDGPAVKTAGRGETAVMVRYIGRVAVARVTVPYGASRPSPAPPGPRTPSSFIDELVAAKWQRMGLTPSAPCTDEEFIRRASLDLIGTLPTPDEVRAFLAECASERSTASPTPPAPAARARLVDRLLERPEYVDYWTLKWGDLLRNNRAQLGEKGMWSFYNWLRAAMRENKPVDALARELITAQGSTYSNGPANFYRVARNPSDLAETTSQVFLGIRLQCAKCHHHPYEKWSQDDYYGLAAFFARVGLKGSDEFGIFGGEQVVRLNAGGEVTHPKNGKVMPPRPLEADSRDDPLDRRRALAEWLTSKENLLFARNWVNRFWGYVMGRGIVEPIDDLRATNPPSNPELLDALAKEFIAHGFDQKHLLRTILNSRVYQLSSTATPANRQDEVFFSHFPVKRMPAEVLYDAINLATGTSDKFNRLPRGTRAISLPDPAVDSFFLDTFGRPQRLITCECERSGEPNISQALHLMNGEFLQGKVTHGEGRLAKLLAANKSDEEILAELYLSTLSRLPRPEEAARIQAAFRQPFLRRESLPVLPVVALELAGFRSAGKAPAFAALKEKVNLPPTRKERFEDILWALLNSRDFMFVH